MLIVNYKTILKHLTKKGTVKVDESSNESSVTYEA